MTIASTPFDESFNTVSERSAAGQPRLARPPDGSIPELTSVKSVTGPGRQQASTRSTLPARGRRVMSLASGPAEEPFDVYALLPEPSALASTLVDIDLQALAYVADRRDPMRLKKHMTLLNENLVHLATGKRSIAVNA